MGGVISELIGAGAIERIGRNRYIASNSRHSIYHQHYSEQLETIASCITDKYPLVVFMIWDTLALNEFLNHQIANSTIFVEVEPVLERAVFEHLRQTLDRTVLFKPDQKSLNTYWEPGVIVVQKLTSQVPTSRENKHLPALEKIVVDLFANKLLETLFSQDELPSVIEQIFERYTIDESRLYRYAKRRNCYERILAFIRDKTKVLQKL